MAFARISSTAVTSPVAVMPPVIATLSFSFSRVSASIRQKSCMQHDFRLHINRGVQPCFFLVCELDLFFINRNAVWLNGKVLFVVVSVCLIPVVNRCSGSANAEPLAEVTTLG
jgi:hypothetical protein